jgi:hypothetical protein
MYRHIPLLTFAFILGFIVVDCPARTWTDKKGRQVEGDLLGIEGGMVKIRRTQDGKEFNVPLDGLSAADQAFVKSRQTGTADNEPSPVTDPPFDTPWGYVAGVFRTKHREILIRKYKMVQTPFGGVGMTSDNESRSASDKQEFIYVLLYSADSRQDQFSLNKCAVIAGGQTYNALGYSENIAESVEGGIFPKHSQGKKYFLFIVPKGTKDIQFDYDGKAVNLTVPPDDNAKD